MIQKRLKGLYLLFLAALGSGLAAVIVPGECSREEATFLEKFKYITQQEGFQKPQKGEWTFYPTGGPLAGGSVSALTQDDEKTIFAGIFGDGVYKKKLGEDKWEPVKKGIKDPYLLSLLFTREGIIFAGTIRGGIFKSVDKGKTWTDANHGLTNLEVSAIAEYEKEIFIGTGAGVFKSSDQGQRWEAVNKGMESTLVRSLFIDAGGHFFAGTGGRGIFKSVDKGKSWQSINFKLQGESGLNENYIRVISGSLKNKLYAGTFGGGVFKSADGGRTWAAHNAGLVNTSIRSVQVAADGTVYAGTGEGVFKSTDEGHTWSSINGDLPDKNVQTMLLTAENQIVMGTGDGIYILQARGKESHWIHLERGITYPAVQSVIGDPEKGFYAATQGEGVFRSKDGGLTWAPMNEGFPDLNIRTITQDKTHTLYTGTEEGVYRGDQIKKRWVLLDEGIGKSEIYTLYIDPNNRLYSGTEKGLFNLDSSSNHWEKIALPVEGPVHSISGDGQSIFALMRQEIFQIQPHSPASQPIGSPNTRLPLRGVFFKGGLYAWTDHEIFAGNNILKSGEWILLSELPERGVCQTFLVETFNGREFLFAGTDKGIFWSPDHGKTWNKGSGKESSANIISLYAPFPGTLLAGSGEHGVLVGLKP